MGFLDFLKKKDEKGPETAGKKTEKKPAGKKEETGEEADEGFNEPCALCNKAGTDKKWAGQYWHVRCLRSARRGAKGMI